jgi:uncharacterized protein YjbI with pentapeptide repeats
MRRVRRPLVRKAIAGRPLASSGQRRTNIGSVGRKIEEMQAEELIEQLELATEQNALVYTLRDKVILGTLDLSNRIVEVAVDIKNCRFKGKVDLRYCEFKQAIKFRECIFEEEFNSGDDTDSHTIYRKNLVCNDARFKQATLFRGARCEGYALFRRAGFLRREPLVDRTHGAVLETPPADFTGASFTGGLDCTRTLFYGGVSLNGIDCGIASFRGTRFLMTDPLKDETHGFLLETPPIDFTGASFKYLECDGALFAGAVSFRGIDCEARASFQDARFGYRALLNDAAGTLLGEIEKSVPVDFTDGSFGYLNALGAKFDGAVSFNSVRCTGDAVFKRAKFWKPKPEDDPDPQVTRTGENNIDFKYSDFQSSLILQGALFKRPVTLKRARVSDSLNLNQARFQDSVSFYGTRIGRLRFRSPCFRSNSVDLRECTFDALAGFEVVVVPDRLYKNGLCEILRPHNVLAKIVDHKKFSMDPYLQLEKDYNRKGDEAGARKIYRKGRLQARKNATRLLPVAEGNTEIENTFDRWTLLRHAWNRFLTLFTGYGVQTWRLFLFAIGFILVGMGMFWSDDALVEASGSSLAPGGTLVASTAPAGERSSYGFWERIYDRATYSVDLFLPVVRFGVDERWEPNHLSGQRYAAIHMFFGWLVVPLLLASLAGIIKRPS